MANDRTENLVIALAIAGIMAVGAALAFSYVMRPDEPGAETVVIETGERYQVTVNLPSGHPRVLTGNIAHDGTPEMVRCNTCHTTREPNLTRATAEGLVQFHQGMHFRHGTLSCVSCHNPENYETLRLANGRSIPFSQAMELCAQCHGPQHRDYLNGSHGGMRGYWDLSRGPRERNSCTDCHDPHAPAFPKVLPVFPPKQRAGTKGGGSH